MSSVLAIGVLMLSGLAVGRIASGSGLSSVIGYLVAGLVLGHAWPGLGGSISAAGAGFVAEIGLALITFVIGGELEVERLRALPRSVVGITVAQAVGSLAAVAGAAHLLGQPTGLGLILGAIAAATAPSTTIMIARKQKSEGPLTQALVSVVAMNDSVCILMYAMAIAVARALPDGVVSRTLTGVIGISAWEVLGSAVVGVVVGIALGFFVKYARGADELIVIVLGSILLTSGLSGRMHVSPIIASLVLGVTVSNLVVGSRKVFAAVDRFSPPIYVLLFCLAGVPVRFRSLWAALGFFLAYVVARALGKVVGVWISAALSGADRGVRRYLGVSLLPQAGLAAALAVAACAALPEQSEMIASMVIPGVLLFEAIGPAIVVMSLKKAGEIRLPEASAVKA
ncbi:MAG: cation:proton antiporter [Clostridia bacterium]|nr:cation:proton antiporter [Clostridia bacterium]